MRFPLWPVGLALLLVASITIMILAITWLCEGRWRTVYTLMGLTMILLVVGMTAGYLREV